ncbi:MAG: BON domain-containing protein [Betaproteobacteria bacterium]|nr:MAG: BON domain-containing protein [Betaproteobacteria bacterium]
MKAFIAVAAALAVVACSPSEPPKPAAKAPEAAPPAVAVAKPEAKPEPAKPDPNKELAAKVKQALEAPDAKLPGGAIDVTAADGKVSLWGAVTTDAERRRAAQLAQKVDGVRSVDNQLKVVKGS